MNIERIQSKIKSIAYSNTAKTSSIILLMIFIAAGYLFFFNSTKIFGENYEYTISQLGEIITLENNHTVKLTRADVDPDRNCIEYEFYFQNSNYDGCDDYNINIKSTTRTGKISVLEAKTICADSDIYVIRAQLPKSWTAIVADITVKNAENITLEAKFYSNSESLYKTKIEGSTREYFLKLDTYRNIEKLGNEIIALQDKNTNLESKISEIESKIITLQERMIYMTAEDLKEAEINLNSMKSEKENSIKQIDDNKKLISEYTESISNLKNELSKEVLQ